MVISGDVVNQCNPDGYDQAKTFLVRIGKKFNLGAEKVLVIPGNHDMSRDASKTAYAAKQSKGVVDETNYKKRFSDFRKFFKKAINEDYQTKYAQQIIWREYIDQKVLIVGLNSAWELDHNYTWRSGLHPDALNQTIEKAAKDEYGDWLKIIVWHHPIKTKDAVDTGLNKSWIHDDGFMDQLAVAGFSMILHGHTHESMVWPFSLNTTKKKYILHVVGAGTLDADEDELTPGSFWQYNVIKIAGTKVSIECRKRLNPREMSRPDKDWLEQPDKPVYKFDLLDESD